MKEKKEEFIVVFKKNVAEEHSLEVIQSFGIAFRPGMDSSRGKIYFYATGAKYILTFKSSDQKMNFLKTHPQFLPEIHEMYERLEHPKRLNWYS
ncbi:MAG: hypothetical protein DI538_11100 [Azospira oryzae]|nr:MAG: hypothetical protein DI538_11100 [Azospira oryzae]